MTRSGWRALDGSGWLLKVGADPVAGPGPGVGFQTALLLHLAAVAPELPVQRVVATLDGRAEIAVAAAFDAPAAGSGSGRLVRMTSWLDGRLLGAAPSSAGLRRDIGGTLARLNVALRGFTHPGASRSHRWDLQNFGALRPLLAELPADGRGGLADCLDRFEAVVAPRLAGRASQVIHTDFHGENLLTDGSRVTGVLDFGDALACRWRWTSAWPPATSWPAAGRAVTC